jgi:hypothetical protein
MTDDPIQEDLPQSVTNKRKIRLRVFVLFGAACIIFVVVVLGFIFDGNEKQPQRNDTPTTATPSSAASKPSRISASATFPPLHFKFSGRLPTKFHGIQLGMTVDQVLARNPSLKYCKGSTEPDPNATLCNVGSSDDFFLTLTFSQGRLIDLDSEVGSIRPEDAALFNTNTLNQLGKPDVKIYEGSSTDTWVWVDGDVRIRYSNRSNDDSLFGVSGTRTVDMSLVVYPALIAAEKNSKSSMSREDLLALEKQQWGVDQPPIELRTLQRDVSGIELLMTPWQVRSVLPGIEINTISDDEATGLLETAKVDTWVSFWDGHAMVITKCWYDVPADQLPQIRAKLLHDYGTPSNWLPPSILPGSSESFTWEDKDTQVGFVLHPKGKGDFPEVDAWFRDRQLTSSKEAARADANPPTFKAAPETHSFF